MNLKQRINFLLEHSLDDDIEQIIQNFKLPVDLSLMILNTKSFTQKLTIFKYQDYSPEILDWGIKHRNKDGISEYANRFFLSMEDKEILRAIKYISTENLWAVIKNRDFYKKPYSSKLIEEYLKKVVTSNELEQLFPLNYHQCSFDQKLIKKILQKGEDLAGSQFLLEKMPLLDESSLKVLLTHENPLIRNKAKCLLELDITFLETTFLETPEVGSIYYSSGSGIFVTTSGVMNQYYLDTKGFVLTTPLSDQPIKFIDGN